MRDLTPKEGSLAERGCAEVPPTRHVQFFSYRKMKTSTSPFIYGGAVIFMPEKKGNLQYLINAKIPSLTVTATKVLAHRQHQMNKNYIHYRLYKNLFSTILRPVYQIARTTTH